MSNLTLHDNTITHYKLIEGDSSSPYLIFLHDGLGCAAMWNDFPDQLCRKTKCPGLVYDRAGYGQSSPSHSARTIHYMHDYALKELPAVIEALIPNTPYFLVGHSDGGSISLILGAENPPLLQGIISEAAHVFVEPETLTGIQRADEAFGNGKLDSLFTYHGEKTYSLFKSWSDTWRSAWFKTWNIEYLLPAIECPLLVIQGSEDQYGTEKQVHSILSQASGSVESSIIAGCGHSPHQEQPELVLEIMSTFVERIR